MNNSIASPLDAASSMRQLKILVLLLLFSNVVLGVFGYWFLRELDRKYSSLIGDTVPTLKDLQRLTVATSEGMHGTNPAFVNGPEEHRLTMVQRGRDALQRDRDMRHRVLNARWFLSNQKAHEDLDRSGDAFDNAAASILDLLQTGKMEEAAAAREASLRPVYERYIAQTTQSSQSAHEHSLRTNDTLTLKTGSVAKILLGIGSWPIVLFAILASLFVTLMIVVLFFVPKGEPA